MNTKTVTTLFLAAMAVSGIQATWAVSGGPDTFGYTYMDSKELEGPIYAFEDISGSGTPVVLADDEVSGAVALGFDFEFYGIEYSEIYISSNGFLTVLDGQDFAFEGTFLPDTGDPNGVIAGWWTDLNPAEGGSIHVQTLDLAWKSSFRLSPYSS